MPVKRAKIRKPVRSVQNGRNDEGKRSVPTGNILQSKIRPGGGGGAAQGGNPKTLSFQKPTFGTDNGEILTKEQQVIVKKIHDQLVKKRKREMDLDKVMPLDYDLQQRFDAAQVEGAEREDKEYYRDGVFYEDEQKQKTNEILEKAKMKKGLRGLDFPEDPGFWPPVEYEAPDIKDPVYTFTSVVKSTGVIKDYYIFPFTWDQIGTDWTITVIGKRRSGKTRFILSMMGYALRPHFPRVFVFTKTKCSGEYAKIIPEAYIFDGFKEDVLIVLFQLQKLFKKRQKKGKFHGNMNLLIILDDCLSDDIKYKSTIGEVFFEGRHLDICFIISSQDTKGITPACSGNTDLAVCFNVRSERDKEAVRTKFCDFFKNNDDMEALVNQACHRQWHFVAYDQHEPSVDPRFTIFCGRAPDPPPFVMGCKGWWKKNMKQLEAIVNENPELRFLLYSDDWGIIGEEEFNQVL